MNDDTNFIKNFKKQTQKRSRKIKKMIKVVTQSIPELSHKAAMSRLTNLTERTVMYHRGKKFVYHKRITNRKVLMPLIRHVMPDIIARDIMGVTH
jgi:RNA-binding protein YhbY